MDKFSVDKKKTAFKIACICSMALALVLIIVAIALLVTIQIIPVCVGLVVAAVICGAVAGFCFAKYYSLTKQIK